MTDPQVAKALRFIADHTHRPLRVVDVLGQIPTSRRSLEVRFKRATGRTILHHIVQVRIERVRLLLRETDLPMPVIAARCGFSGASFLCVAFRRMTGATPTGYRRQFRLRR